MTITEKVAFIKGLAEGLSLDENNKQDKILKAIIDLLGDMADDIVDIDDSLVDLSDQIDAIDEDLADVEEALFEDDDEEYDSDFYEVKCPSCGEEICIEEEMLDEDGMECPACGTDLEFDFSCCDPEDCDDDCSCGCKD